MKDWLEKQIQNGLPDLTGLAITAHIPIRDRLLNELISELLKQTPSPTESGPDFRSLLKFVEKAEVNSSDGVIALDVVVKV